MQNGRGIDGRELEPDAPAYSSGFVSSEILEEGWYVAAFDARDYRPYGPIWPYPSRGVVWGPLDYLTPSLDGVAYARLRIGDALEWVRTFVSVVYERGVVEFSLLLTSTVTGAVLEGSEVIVRRGGVVVPCSPVQYGDLDGYSYVFVACPGRAAGGLDHGDTVEVQLVSDQVGHPLGAMRPQEVVIDRDRPRAYPVAPEMGLDVLRAAYGIEGGGT
jgi:hypothetical protein